MVKRGIVRYLPGHTQCRACWGKRHKDQLNSFTNQTQHEQSPHPTACAPVSPSDGNMPRNRGRGRDNPGPDRLRFHRPFPTGETTGSGDSLHALRTAPAAGLHESRKVRVSTLIDLTQRAPQDRVGVQGTGVPRTRASAGREFQRVGLGNGDDAAVAIGVISVRQGVGSLRRCLIVVRDERVTRTIETHEGWSPVHGKSQPWQNVGNHRRGWRDRSLGARFAHGRRRIRHPCGVRELRGSHAGAPTDRTRLNGERRPLRAGRPGALGRIAWTGAALEVAAEVAMGDSAFGTGGAASPRPVPRLARHGWIFTHGAMMRMSRA